jgi:hypothetical protein
MTQADYVALASRILGFQAGTANSAQLNKVWRQASMMSAALANYISVQNGTDVLDDGNLANLIAALTSSITIGSGIKPARIVAASANINLVTNDYAVGFLRVAAPAALQATLPTAAQVGQEYVIEDLNKSFAAFPITVVPPAGDNIAGDANFVCNVNKQVVKFRRYAVGGAWSVKA